MEGSPEATLAQAISIPGSQCPCHRQFTSSVLGITYQLFSELQKADYFRKKLLLTVGKERVIFFLYLNRRKG